MTQAQLQDPLLFYGEIQFLLMIVIHTFVIQILPKANNIREGRLGVIDRKILIFLSDEDPVAYLKPVQESDR
jgi:hypothetical protein